VPFWLWVIGAVVWVLRAARRAPLAPAVVSGAATTPTV